MNNDDGRTLNEIGRDAWQTAEDAGWHDAPTTDFERLALVHSEVSEALETRRRNGTRSWVEVDGKPDGWGPELADVIIRVAELAHLTGVDLDTAVACKLAYNRIRADVPRRSDAGKVI